MESGALQRCEGLPEGASGSVTAREVNNYKDRKQEMKTLERLIENTILASRWILVVFYMGLAAALLIYAVSFIKKLAEFGDQGAELRRGRRCAGDARADRCGAGRQPHRHGDDLGL